MNGKSENPIRLHSIIFFPGTLVFSGLGSDHFCGQYSSLQLYLSKDSLEASITTAKSSEVNVLVPGAGADSGYVSIRVLTVL